MKYCKGCGFTDERMRECPYCGEALVDYVPNTPAAHGNKVSDSGVRAAGSDGGATGTSVFSKYAHYIDDDTLYRTAISKLDSPYGEERAEAEEMLRALAFKGNCDGMYKLAEHLLSLNPPDEKTATEWLKIGADLGHLSCKLKLRMLGVDKSSFAKLDVSGESSDFTSRVKSALPSIVSITTSFAGKGNKVVWSAGSGFILDGGFVITNAHVVTAKPLSITAEFEPGIDERAYNLIPLTINVDLDLAILRFTGLKDKKVSSENHLSMRVGDLQYGEDVYTIGNPLGLGLSVSRGVISCPDRESDYPRGVSQVVQTDISANHGNSGGALLDRNNNVIGMVTFLPGDTKGGIAMCVPTDYIIKELNKL